MYLALVHGGAQREGGTLIAKLVQVMNEPMKIRSDDEMIRVQYDSMTVCTKMNVCCWRQRGSV
jgi:hypothetical protein